MALVTRLATAHIDASTAMFQPTLSGDMIAGEELDPVSPVYLNTDGKYYMADGTAANNKAVIAGWTYKKVRIGQALDLCPGLGTVASYGSGLTPGAKLFLAATKGRLDTVATTGDAVGIAQVLHDGASIRFTRLI
jgi:hypothetical protein